VLWRELVLSLQRVLVALPFILMNSAGVLCGQVCELMLSWQLGAGSECCRFAGFLCFAMHSAVVACGQAVPAVCFAWHLNIP
jgi:hypothetical protein